MRAGGGVDDRVRPLLLHLAVFPFGALSARVLEDDDLARFFFQRPGRGVGLEAELHPLPVALVEVVELVEVPVEPELEGKTVVVRFAGDVGIGDRRRLAFLQQLPEGAGVDAGVAEHLAFVVEVPAVAEAGDVGRGRRLLHRDQPAVRFFVGEGDGRVAEHRVDAGRLVLLLLGVAGRVQLLPQHRDRHVLLRQLRGGGVDRRGFQGGGAGGRGKQCQRSDGERDETPMSSRR